MLDINKSRYVDFQKVRIQETQAELPRGCIPRRYDNFWLNLIRSYHNDLDVKLSHGTEKLSLFTKNPLFQEKTAIVSQLPS